MAAWKCMVSFGMTANIDGVRIKKIARRRALDRIGSAFNDLKELLEEATNLFRKGSED